jgi:DNA-binding GntR family transcriptional regulator
MNLGTNVNDANKTNLRAKKAVRPRLPRAEARVTPEAEALSEAGDVRSRLREDLIDCVLVPGQWLKLSQLRDRYGVSVGSLREALPPLVAEGLVEAEANRGFRVAPVTLAELDDITNLRVDFERKAVTLAIAHGDDKWEAGIVAAYHMMIKADAACASAPNQRAWNERHHRFHEALVASCPSVWLLRFRAILFNKSQRYRALARSTGTSPPRVTQHKQLMEAALNRDAERCANLIEAHIRATAEKVRTWLADNRYQ